ncbi:hypothetical protein BGZ61DRAFT_450808 [Ilyonectria robusta]|uniref:uncharacterized protein n=1 Tax=Ilyonectria robusta TaxID=1079257 RepID=UPI001E8D5FF3|nr:uncharacterized protein BGZ61DRAFT_450808 [Ilyonectria robusta]KAH8699512.1 hypothetical protein BGZ61DRAFT_450808 [Ilyonectria robusta]
MMAAARLRTAPSTMPAIAFHSMPQQVLRTGIDYSARLYSGDGLLRATVPREHNDGEIIHIARFVGTRFIART